jgi:hypothetical protein
MHQTICGIDCTECKEFGTNCQGCNNIKGKVFWSQYMGLDTCPMYHCCVDEKQLPHCGKCSDLPCNIYFETRDPEMSEEQHLAAIQKRVEILRALD